MTSLVSGVTEAGAFWLFGGFTILTFFFCLLFVPETKGKSLDDIQLLFRYTPVIKLIFGYIPN